MDIQSTASVTLAARPQRRSLRAAGVVFACTLGNALSLTPTVGTVFGVFLIPICLEFHWSRAAVSAATAIMSLMTALSYPFVGWFSDRFGARRTALIGVLALGLGILSLGLARAQPALFYLQFALLGVVGALPSVVTYGKLISEWFEGHRGLWLGLSGGAGNGLGVTFLPVLAGFALVRVGWRESFMGIGLIVLLVGLPLQLLLLAPAPVTREHDHIRPRALEGLTLKQSARTLNFWLLMSTLPVGGGLLMAVAGTIVPLLLDRQMPIGLAIGVVSAMGLSCSIGEPIVGLILDRSSRPRLLTPLFLLALLAQWLLLNGGGAPTLILAGSLIGFSMAGEFSALSFLTSRYFGRKALGAVSGIAFSSMLIAGSIGTVALNRIFDLTGTYKLAIFATAPFLIWNTIAPLFLGKYPYRADTDVH